MEGCCGDFWILTKAHLITRWAFLVKN
jgi:hypothetical protein